jgi:hypothetical protein
MKNFKLLTMVVILSVLLGCKEEPLVPKPLPIPVVELYGISATKTKINLGEETQISWITNGVVSVNGKKIEGSSVVVKPDITTVYRIISSNGYSNKKDSITIEVVQPDPEIVRRSEIFARAPWFLYEHWAFSEGSWDSYSVSSRSTNAYHLKPGVGYWTVTASMDTISNGNVCSITMDSLFRANEKFKYELTDTTLALHGFSNTSVILKYKRKKAEK